MKSSHPALGQKASLFQKRSSFIAFSACLAGAIFLFGCSKEVSRNARARKETSESHAGRRSAATRRTEPPEARGPRLAIILDDMGNDRTNDEAVIALPYRLTVSVLPHLPLSAEVADDAARHGDEVMLHLPMQPDSETTKTGTIELRPGMPSGEVRSVLAGMLETVPHVSGVNNHEGSKATADPQLMDALMPALHARHLFFIDSRTTASTVAYDTARRYDVPAASRKVFLDDSLDRTAIEQQIDLAVKDAGRDGEAIAIGHPHSETIAVLRDALPQLKRHGVQLVFASDLVR